MFDYILAMDIDKYSLDEELLRQPTLMRKHSEALAEVQEERDSAKDDLARLLADLYNDVKSRPEAYGVEAGSRGVTETAVLNAVEVHEDIVAARRRLVLANKNLTLLTGIRGALEDRSRSLSNLVRLYTSDYWSQTTSTSPGRAAAATVNRAAQQERVDAGARARVQLRGRSGTNGSDAPA